jgi:hypothetical protein
VGLVRSSGRARVEMVAGGHGPRDDESATGVDVVVRGRRRQRVPQSASRYGFSNAASRELGHDPANQTITGPSASGE